MKLIIGMIVSLLLTSLPAHSELASPESIKNLMEKTGAGDMGVQAMNQMLPALKKILPDASKQFWTDFMAEVSGDDLVAMTIPIYQKHLSQEDIDAINAFYDTPAGQKLIKTQPLLVQESMAAGQVWGQKIAQDVINKYKTQNQP